MAESVRAAATVRARAAARGFTLVEVLVALFVMALLAGMAWQGVDAMLRAREAGQSRIERTLRLATVLAQWEQDLQALVESPLVPPLVFDGAALRLVRRQGDGQQIVVWALREGRWQRWASPAAQHGDELQELWLRSQQLQGGEPGQLDVLAADDAPLDWQVYFYRGNSWSNAQSSGDLVQRLAPVAPPASAPASAATMALAREATLLPGGVRVVLQFAGDGRSLTRDVLLGPQAP